eukprot:CAMPEP_0202861700 /NCGR_PEP_ID=MMETSP1391-20130828/3008_1 /ASSEMBLY_ACC=CAM_ASM_000867 /TAXON_ID=1034604 /ORGANISM="Chlamydomonas leiostraca, Strain SAG 11-49" /LENGTH=760 /DNA_ID=CAMNT_0049541129 /DNA_START=57 /DNA_END=2339 /DNA_ORIENTATION=-
MGAEEAGKAPAQTLQICQLPYPDRYQAAKKFIDAALPNAKPLGHDSQLLLYALGQQVEEGPCTGSKPWGWNVVEAAKHQAWKQLGGMAKMEAMRLYVRTVDEEQADWYPLLLQYEAAPKPAPDAAGAAAGANGGAPVQPATSYARELQWSALPAVAGGADGRRPCPRYEHGAALVGGSLYVIGGNYAGRYLSDLWRLDTHTLTWTQLTPVPVAPPAAATAASPRASLSPRVSTSEPGGSQQQPAAAQDAGSSSASQGGAGAAATAASPLGPCAGHSVTVWGTKLVILGGHVKHFDAKQAGAKGAAANATMLVRVYEASSNTLWTPATSGPAPGARGGHSAVLLCGTKLYVFGGEDAGRRALGDLHCLDLETWTWSGPLTPQGTAPAPRAAHAAAAYQGRYMLLFGGGSTATCFGDVAILDARAPTAGGATGLRWLAPTMQGPKVSARAGHCGAVAGDAWYVVGGGNNVKGCTDLLALDLRGLGSLPPYGADDTPAIPLMWHSLSSTPPRDALSSEGVSLLVLQHPQGEASSGGSAAGNGGSVAPPTKGGVLLAFGGYNGKYNNMASVLRTPVTMAPLLTDAATAPAATAKPAATAAAAKPAAAAPAAAAKEAPKPNAQQAQAAAAAAAAADKEKQIAELKAALENARKDAEAAVREAAAAKDSSAQELALLRKQAATAQAQLETAQKGLEDARAALAKESARVLRLEAQLAEAQRGLAAAAEERKELEALRRQAKEAAEAAAKKGSGGLWGYIAGSGNSS